MSRTNTDHIGALKAAIADAILDTGEELGFSEPGFDQGLAIETSLTALGITFIAGCMVFDVNPLTTMLKLLTTFSFKEGDDE